jgi:hypothetical protein
VRGGEIRVSLEGAFAGRFAGQRVAKLPPAGDAEVEGRTDSLGGEGEAMPGRIADEEDSRLGGRPELVGDPVALVAHSIDVEVGREPHGRLLDVEARVERADPDPHLVSGGKAPRIPRRDV